MINQKDNEIRNEIMKNVNVKQMKRKRLNEFIRREREKILLTRSKPVEETTMASSAGDLSKSVDARKSVKSRFKEAELPNIKPGAKPKPVPLEMQIKGEFTDYMKSILTRQSKNPNHQKPQSKDARKGILSQVRFDKGERDHEEVEVDDIANHIQRELRAGWRTSN